jgi:hypothetical protein
MLPASSRPASAEAGLTPAPQAFRLSARPAARMFLAAPVIPIVPGTTRRTEPFPDRQRPWRPPRAHRPDRSFDDGVNHRDTVTTIRPQRSAFSSSSRTNPPHPASEITRPNRRFVTTPRCLRPSTRTVVLENQAEYPLVVTLPPCICRPRAAPTRAATVWSACCGASGVR